MGRKREKKEGRISVLNVAERIYKSSEILFKKPCSKTPSDLQNYI
jgi:hypothetical protein